MKKVMILFGTRPEAIKMAPVIKALKSNKSLKTIVCSSGQHREMLRQVLDIFKLKIDYDLDLMKPDQNLYDITINSAAKLQSVLQEQKPDILLVQGDTTTAFVSALSAFYSKIRIGHIEAGLRSYNIQSPYPEEANRRFISVIADYHFAPTPDAAQNLLSEGIQQNKIFMTGNTVVDALSDVKQQLSKPALQKKIIKTLLTEVPADILDHRFILITMHRREKFGQEFKNVLVTMRELAAKYPDLYFIYPVHLNPNVQNPVNEILKNVPNICLISPQNYLNFIYLMSRCYFIMSDSGGVQEECYVFKKTVMIMRDVTERNEAIKAGYAFLAGSNTNKIKKIFSDIYKNLESGFDYFQTENPFGDGKAAKRIADILAKKI